MEIPVEVTGKEREEWLISSYIINKVTGKASGTEDQECLLNYPRDIYFIGNLRPRNNNEASLNQAEFMNKLAPSAFGAEFKLDNSEECAEISVELSWSNYYRAFPTYEQQLDWANQVAGNTSVSNHNAARREDLFIRFKKIRGSAIGLIKVTKKEGQNWEVDKSDLESKIQSEIARSRGEVLEDDERLRLRTQGRMFTLTADALSSEENYNQFLNSLSVENDCNWNWEVNSEIYSVNQNSDETILLLQFVNSSDYRLSDKWFEPYIFNSIAKFKFNKGKVLPFELELAPKSFRYDRHIWGKGFNCGLERRGENFITNHTPIHPQWRYKTSNVPEASFQGLANDPIPILTEIREAMNSYVHVWDEQQEAYIKKFGEEFWQQNYQKEYLKDKKQFEEEIEQFKAGVDLIDQDEDILLAFKLSNESFRRAGLNVHGEATKDKWRLFQIVFMVSQIPSVVALNPVYEEYIAQRAYADIIYFPTGGGKTEAYLSTLIFHCFYDRLRGKTAGVTSWIRFPLRLLTIQQTQRLANIIGLAELVRREQDDQRLAGKSIDEFSVGYFVGAEATPNEIKVPQSGRPETTWSQALDENARQHWQRVVT